jgi:DNA-binding response OmpR family regulator
MSRLFIIEDDANILYGLQAQFSVSGFQVKIDPGSGTVEEILNKIKNFNPDFIVLDLILPRVDGFAVLGAIKADKDIAGSLVFVFTNLSDEDSRVRSRNLGADYYFIKSDFIIDEFVKKVKNIIKNRSTINK